MYENEKQNQSGRSMMEMLGVLAIVASLTIGGIIAFHQAMNKNRSNKLVDGITHTVNNVKTLFIKQDQYEELSTDEAFELGIISDRFKKASDKITHDYGGEVKIQAKTTSDGQTYYAIAINGLPRDVAMHIATQDWGGSGDLVSVNLNDGNDEEQANEDEENED
jgi:Tfp pilus assembly protein FimT